MASEVGYMAILLVLCYSLETQGNSLETQGNSLEKMTGPKAPHAHIRKKRIASILSSDYVLDVVVKISNMELLQTLLSTLSYPLAVGNTSLITNINTTADSVETDIVLDMRIPLSIVPPNFAQEFNNILTIVLPYTLSPTLRVLEVDITTECFPNSTGGLECQCRDQFAWSCDMCDQYGACGDPSNQTCGCIFGRPPLGDFCEPITNVTTCPIPTPETITTPPVTTPQVTTPPVTTPQVTTPPVTTPEDLVETDIVLDMRIPLSNLPPNFAQEFNNILDVVLPYTLSPALRILEVDITTDCFPNSTGGLECQCRDQFAWSCDMCDQYGACGDPSNQTCGCIFGRPPLGDFCEPITNVTQCQSNPTTVIPTTVTTTTPNIARKTFSFTMDVTFESAFNNPTSTFYRNIFNSIQKQSQTHISTFKEIDSITFQRGSTICEYTLTATSFLPLEIKALKVGIFKEVSATYPVFYDSPSFLKFDPPQVLFGGQVTVTCGPPPLDLFGTNITAEWSLIKEGRKETILSDDLHTFSSGRTKLTVLRFFSTDNGIYKCKLIRQDNSAFRQSSNGEFQFKEEPLIMVSPIEKTVPCNDVSEVLLRCSVNSPYEVEFIGIPTEGTNEITHQFPISCGEPEEIITCQVKDDTSVSKNIQLVLSTQSSFLCNDDVFGAGSEGSTLEVACNKNEKGEKILVCGSDGSWRESIDNCILIPIVNLLEQSESLNNNSLPGFLVELSNVAINSTDLVVASPATVNAIVVILTNVANLSTPITNDSMTNILITAGILTLDSSKETWDILNNKDGRNITVARGNSTTTNSTSSSLLFSLENLTGLLTNDSFDIETPSIILNKTRFTDTFNADFNSSVEISIPESGGLNTSITVITFSSMDNVLTARDQSDTPFNVINGRVVLVQSSSTVNNVSFTFDVLNDTLGNPQCVFWNFDLFDREGGWDDEGCELVRNINNTVTCNCNHLTSFSILMSPFIPAGILDALALITYIGVGISMASLVICLIIEAVIWKKIKKNNTSYLRHVSIVNIAVSLLIADIWFIIGASVAETSDPPACTAATFFVHFFYLALFFWMLASALLLLYRTISVFDGGLSKKSMLAIGFSLGYGAPLIIVVITIAVTAPKDAYIRDAGCWLNWDQSKALLAFVIPALLIVVINLVILIVVIFKMLRRRLVGDAAQAAERHVLVVIARSLAVLTPIFGLTWGLGVGTMTNPKNEGIHISFAFFNSLQGFFILVFGTLLDKKVRSEIATRSQSIPTGTRSTSAGNSSSSGLNFFRRRRIGGRRDVYNVSSSQTQSSSDENHNFNT